MPPNNDDRIALGLNEPTGLDSNGFQLCVADTQNNRVLLWNALPKDQFDKPDAYIGQQDETGIEFKHWDRSAQTLSKPEACLFVENRLVISDTGNRRALIYNALNMPVY